MKRYIALLRGLNLGHKNKVSMAKLKQTVAPLGYHDVKTHLNSGNLLFSCWETNAEILRRQIEDALARHFGWKIPVHVLEQTRLAEMLDRAPAWWRPNIKVIYHNMIFVLPPATLEQVHAALGELKEGLEQARDDDGAHLLVL